MSAATAFGVPETAIMNRASIIIPTLDAEPHLPALRAMLSKQSLAPLEVVVVDSSSSDATVSIAAGYGWRTHTIPRASFDHGSTRNLGAALAIGDGLVFLTQDAVPADGEWLERLVAPLGEDRVAATFSRQVPRADASPRERFARFRNYPERSAAYTLADVDRLGIRAMFMSNVSSATTRAAFEAVGGFPGRAILNEDGYYAARLLERGYVIRYEASSRVVHSHDYSLRMQFRRYFDIGVSHVDGPELMRTASTTGNGLAFARDQLRYLVGTGAWADAIVAIPELGAKYLAYQLGRRHARIPHALRPALGWNRRYWEEAAEPRRQPGT
jgi:rhamnosyltransferase